MFLNILWDLDGTIINSLPSIASGLQKASGKDLDKEKLLSLLKINSYVVFKHFGLDDSIRVHFKEIERNIHPSEKKPFPDIEQILRESNINVIVTHKDKKSAEELLRYWRLDHYFTEILCLEDDNFPRKPEPDSYKYLHNKYHIDLVVGDRELDFIPARTLGIPTCAFQNSAIKADFHINAYKEFDIVKQSLKKES
ncbi:HAD-IA family hydrolase (plasmid) [Priestia megaterium]|uniref:HAD-IA family hydrolase n=1 Tax=Priestia megaterium TaxID=1404 RepID=A0A6M6DZM8_PRIMG|nr:HAD-IA family hydrolase [Priestia megaterium]